MFSSEFPWATFGVVVLTAIAAIVGGAVVIWGHNGALSFNDYLNYMWKFAAAAGVLGVGRGIKSGLENHAAVSSNLSDVSLLSDLPSLVAVAAGAGSNAGDGDGAGSDSGDQATAIPLPTPPHV